VIKMFQAMKNPARSAAVLARWYLDWYNGFSYNFEKNGELFLIRNLTTAGFRIVFDVGANIGHWSERFLKIAPDPEIFCFEISASTYEVLKTNLKHKAKCFNIGLSNENSEIRYKDYGLYSTVNTISDDISFWDSSLNYKWKTTRVERGDDFCELNGISFIDFLKIDVEGTEQMVLEGFTRMLKNRCIRLVQFEYGYANGDCHFLMKDFYSFFNAFGYEVGVVRRKGIHFREFSYYMNDFSSGPNYVAIRCGDEVLKRRISIAL
jgi:FkbM family methyltransferase